MYELHSDESNPEFMFQDYENCSFFEKLGLIGSYISNDAQYILEEDIPESLPNYIDWEATARNLMFDYFESDGYYFRS